MADIHLVVFNVERGLCVYARTPNNYGILIDCGCSGSFSPAAWLSENEAPNIQHFNGHPITWMVVTHPHDDHVEDIATVTAELSPAFLMRWKGYDWPAVLDPALGYSENVRHYQAWQAGYDQPIVSKPDLGIEFSTWGLTPGEAAAVSSNLQHTLNNSSLVTVLAFHATPNLTWKIVVSGDNETEGWLSLLYSNPEFRRSIAQTDIFVTSHHGHKSGFCAELFKYMGTPLVNISSERAGDESVFDYGQYASGITFNGESRSHLTTRKDGSIYVTLSERGYYFEELDND